MQDAGLQTRGDALGNLAGRRGAGPALVIGSHLDSVADAGRYDGILGVLVGLAVAEATDVPLEVVAFADEEGLRFQSTFLGSRGFIGRIDPGELDLRDHDGIRLGDALGAPLGAPLFEGARAYFEVHIEQGPVLESEDAPLGVVTAIAGQTRFNVVFEGHAGHAGTTPMRLRRDALGAAAEFVLAAERMALARAGAGGHRRRARHPPRRLQRRPRPRRGHARHPPSRTTPPARGRSPRCSARRRRSATAAASRAAWAPIHEHAATPCSPALVARLAEVITQMGLPVRRSRPAAPGTMPSPWPL